MRLMARLLIVIVLAALVAGCGVRMVYNNLDRLMLRWIDNQVSLDAEQRSTARDMIEYHLDWHCASELPDYADWLLEVDADIGSDRISVDVLRGHAQTMAGFWQRLLASVRPSMIEIIVGLDDEQVEQLREAFEERNAELDEQAELEEDQRREQRVQSMERGLRRFLGRLDREQRGRLEQWAAELIPSHESNLEQTRQWQASFFDIIEHRRETDFAEIVAPLLDPGGNWSAGHRELMEHNRERTLEAIVDIHHLASERQIDRLRSRVTSLASDFERLTCR